MSPTKKSSKRIEATTQELLTKLEDQQIEITLLATPLPIVTFLKEAKIFDEPLWIAHPRAKRTIRMVYWKSYFRKDNLGLLANSIIKELPNTVTTL